MERWYSLLPGALQTSSPVTEALLIPAADGAVAGPIVIVAEPAKW